jgi:hypothetical protein
MEDGKVVGRIYEDRTQRLPAGGFGPSKLFTLIQLSRSLQATGCLR